VEVALLLQFSIALFTGMVAATLVPPVRRAIPREVEVLLWVAFFISCAIGVVSISDRNARELTSSAVWGIEQLIHTAVGLVVGGLLGWIYDNRLSIASGLVIVAAGDFLALLVIRSLRKAKGWQPRVRLGEWMEVPPPGHMAFEPQVIADSGSDLNRRVAVATAVAGTAVSSGLTQLNQGIRNILARQKAERLARDGSVGQVESRARLESLRGNAALFGFAAQSWYAAVAAPALSQLAAKTSMAVRSAADAGKRRLGLTQPSYADLIDVQVLLNAQSIGWYGPVMVDPLDDATDSEQDGAESGRSGRLAS
jgi:hypothetical protein